MLDPGLLAVVRFVAILAITQFVVMPLVIRVMQKMNAHPQLIPVPMEQFPPAVFTYFQGVGAGLAQEGFFTIGHFWLQAVVSSNNAFPACALFINPATRVMALASVVYVTGETGVRIATSYVEFTTRLSDDGFLNTNDVQTANSFDPVPQENTVRRTFRFPGLHDTRQLYRLHLYLLNRFATGRERLIPPMGQEVSEFLAGLIRSYERQCKTGLLYRDGDRFRPTLPGAYRMVWRLSPPFKQIALAKRRSEARAMLEEYRRDEARVAGEQSPRY